MPRDAEDASDVVTDLSMATPIGTIVTCRRELKNFLINIQGKTLPANLVILDIDKFEVIMGMDWLASGYTIIDCYKKEVVFKPPVEQEYRFVGSHVKEALEGEVKLENISIVKEFLDIFPENLSRLPPKCEVEFAINLSLGTVSISKASYRMIPVELKELKE
ncbi:uncharacterized protein LOC131148100 [Malania oleifera]|uniref:uncharacterized protein LOC131148100 n=1 Tax=Malania oleifera TaxID=397392 RepID=UPI0025AEA05B|nr:uncharacterized protein LOC131148100 [Malania oleifera]